MTDVALPAPGDPLLGLPGRLGITLAECGPRLTRASLTVTHDHVAPPIVAGQEPWSHAGAAFTLADTACGYGCLAAIRAASEQSTDADPGTPGPAGFTTMTTSGNHLAAAQVGDALEAFARPAHLGATTQVWEAEVRRGDRVIMLFRCTQLLLRPR